MGMELVPVYANDDGDSPGTVKIDPSVVNNLGVRTALAERKNLHQPIKTMGYVQYSEDTLVHIHPRVEGWVETLYVKATGDYVQKGEPLYALYSPELVNAQEEYLVALSRGNSNLREASNSRLRALQMPEAAIAQLTKSKKVQQTIQFTAPQTGFVDNLNIREGFYVQPGTTMMSIGALDEVWVEAQVFEREASLIKVGLAVSMRMDYLPGKVWQGVIDYVYPSLDESTRTLKVRLRFDNPEYLLKPNMFAQVLIENDDEKARLVVPREAVIRTGSQNRVVLALGEGRFKSVEVELGVMSTDAIEVLSGIEEGDEVVTSAQFLLDSESSISSDFMRMSASSDDEKISESMHGQHDEALAPVWVSASIEDVMSDTRMVRMAHEAIEEWGMMAMTMNFTVAEHVDFSALTVGTQLHAQITKTDAGPYQIIGVHIMNADKGMDP
jgi:Cu(I)/Ag(I) efflux system membrane fusion protein